MTAIVVNYEGATYYFNRDWTGEGGWVCIAGRTKGSAGGTPSNTYAHLKLNQDLTSLAVESGFGEYKNFSRYIKKDREKLIRISSPKKTRKSTGLFGGIGISLSSIFDYIDTEEEHKITEFEEIDVGK